ncbi:MAG: RND transporter [Betaproteobacteria bacterium]|nr:RND transporter [Betaproteobacteria bacterium]
MENFRLRIPALVVALALPFAVFAQAAKLTEGEVRKVDIAAGKVTLKHGPIENLGMPGMTMVFRATNPALLDKLKAGDKVRFAADKAGDDYTVSRIEPAR